MSLAAARDVVPGRSLRAVTGTIGAALGAIVAFGPLVGGWLLDTYTFRGAQWFIAICTVIALVLVATVLSETPRYAKGRTFDWLGGALLGIGVLAMMFGFGERLFLPRRRPVVHRCRCRPELSAQGDRPVLHGLRHGQRHRHRRRCPECLHPGPGAGPSPWAA